MILALLVGFSTGCLVAMAATWRRTVPAPDTLLRRPAPVRLTIPAGWDGP